MDSRITNPYQLKINIRNLQKKISISPQKVKKIIFKILSLEGRKKSGEITVCFVDDRQIRELNLMYLGKNQPTEVLAFDLTDSKNKSVILADIAISTERAIANARIFHTLAIYELYLYIIHGVLHILGYDDSTRNQRKIMKNKSTHILNSLNLFR